jgi:hypothetical protein
MTDAREKAEEIVRVYRNVQRQPSMDGHDQFLENSIAAAIEQARAEQREVDAMIAENEPRSWDVNSPDPQTRIATKIRAQPQPETREDENAVPNV